MAWLNASLARRKKLPKLAEMLKRAMRDTSKRQTWQEQLAIARAMTIASGGTIVKRGEKPPPMVPPHRQASHKRKPAKS